MTRAMEKQLLESIHVSPKWLMFKLDNRENFIPQSNGLASGKAPFKEDISRTIPRFNGTNLKIIF